jgi:hypothetical protein
VELSRCILVSRGLEQLGDVLEAFLVERPYGDSTAAAEDHATITSEPSHGWEHVPPGRSDRAAALPMEDFATFAAVLRRARLRLRRGIRLFGWSLSSYW